MGWDPTLGARPLRRAVQHAINREAMGLQELLNRAHEGNEEEMMVALRRLSSRIKDFRSDWERPPHKPVSQTSMAEGDIELF